jgi:hypothetical protein
LQHPRFLFASFSPNEHRHGNIHTYGAHKNKNDNNITPMLIGLDKTTQKTFVLQEENWAGKDKNYVKVKGKVVRA